MNAKLFLMLLSGCIYSSSNAMPIDICYGDVVKLSNLANKQLLASNLKSYANGKFDNLDKADRRYKQLFMRQELNLDCLWIVKGGHSESLRWNCVLGSKIKPNESLRLENLANGSTLTFINPESAPGCVKALTLPTEAGTNEDDLTMQFLTADNEPLTDNTATLNSEIEAVRLKFALSPNSSLSLAVDSKTLEPKLHNSENPQPATASSDLWKISTIEAQVAQKTNNLLAQNVKQIRENKNFIELSNTELSSLALWQDEIATQAIIAGSHYNDFYVYIGTQLDGSSITEKIEPRLTQICLVADQALWGVTREKVIKKALNNQMAFSNWQDVTGQAEIVVANEQTAYRLESIGGAVFKASSINPTVTWEALPAIEEATSIALGQDSTLWWIDNQGSVFKQLGTKKTSIFNHFGALQPRFVKISAAGSYQKNFMALLRSDGQVFVAKNDGLLLNTEIALAKDVAIGQAGSIVVVLTLLEKTYGPTFKTDFETLWRDHQSKPLPLSKNFSTATDLISFYHYQFELSKNDAKALAAIILGLKEALDTSPKSLQNDVLLKDFCSKTILNYEHPELSSQAKLGRQEIAKLFTTSTSIANEKNDTVAKVDNKNPNNSEAKNQTLPTKSAEEKPKVETQLQLMQQQIQESDVKIKALEQENQQLRNGIAQKTAPKKS